MTGSNKNKRRASKDVVQQRMLNKCSKTKSLKITKAPGPEKREKETPSSNKMKMRTLYTMSLKTLNLKNLKPTQKEGKHRMGFPEEADQKDLLLNSLCKVNPSHISKSTPV